MTAPRLGTTASGGRVPGDSTVKLWQTAFNPATPIYSQFYCSQNTGPETFELLAPYPPTVTNDGGYLWAVVNVGTDPVDVEYQAAPIYTVPVGEGALFIYDGNALVYRVLATYSAGGGGTAPAIPLGPLATSFDANIVLTWAQSGGVITLDALNRTIQLPLITAAEVGRIMVCGNRQGSGGTASVIATGGQAILAGAALTFGRFTCFLACESVTVPGTFYWMPNT